MSSFGRPQMDLLSFHDASSMQTVEKRVYFARIELDKFISVFGLMRFDSSTIAVWPFPWNESATQSECATNVSVCV